MNFYTFPTSCAVQILGNFYTLTSAKEETLKGLAQEHRLTLAVTGEAQLKAETMLEKAGFLALGTFNRAHSAAGTLKLWVIGGEFKITECKALMKRSKDANEKDTVVD